jgi:hypothetical protein
MNVNQINIKILLSALVINVILVINFLLWIYFPPSPNLALVLLIFMLITLPVLQFYIMNTQYEGSVLLVLLFTLIGLLLTLYSGSPDWDTRSIWLLHAKQIYYDGNLYAPLDPYVSAPRDYPLMVPALMASWGIIVGVWNEAYPKSATIFFYIAPLLVYTFLFPSFIYFGIFLIGLVYISSIYLFNGYMDVIQAMYLCSILTILNIALRKKVQKELPFNILFTILLTLLIVIALQIKNEGTVGILCIIFSAIFFKQLRCSKYLIAFILAIIFYIYFWKFPLSTAHITSDLFTPGIAERAITRAFSLENWITIVSAFIGKSGFWYILFGICFIIDNDEFKYKKLILIVLILYTAALLFVYFVTGAAFPWQLEVSIDRTTIFINLCILTYCLWVIQRYHPYFKKFAVNYFDQLSKIARLSIAGLLLSIPSIYFYQNFLASSIEKGSVINFCKGCSSSMYLENIGVSNDLGWSHPEEWGVWMSGYKAVINIPMPRLQSLREITLQVQAFLPTGINEQSFDISIRGEKSGSFTLNNHSITTIRVPFSNSPSLLERYVSTNLQIELIANNPIQVNQYSQSEDNRKLSIGLISITFN